MTESHKAGCRRKGCIIPAASIALIVAVLVGREVYIAATATPGSAVNYRAKATELVDSYQPKGGENGWGALLDAVDVYNAAAAQDSSGIGWSDAFKFALDPSSYDPARTLYPLERYLSTAECATAASKAPRILDHLEPLAAAVTDPRHLPLGGPPPTAVPAGPCAVFRAATSPSGAAFRPSRIPTRARPSTPSRPSGPTGRSSMSTRRTRRATRASMGRVISTSR